MTETRPTQGGPACACQRVKYDPIIYPGTAFSESWVCTDCGSRFQRQHWLDRARAENKALEERVRLLRERVQQCGGYGPDVLADDDAKATGEPVATTEDEHPADAMCRLAAERVRRMPRAQPPDDRASRRRAYVRDKAPVILAGLCTEVNLLDTTTDGYRKQAIEQAGLIFDETEQP